MRKGFWVSFQHVSRVVFMRAFTEVFRVYTGRPVAVMQRELPPLDGPTLFAL